MLTVNTSQSQKSVVFFGVPYIYIITYTYNLDITILYYIVSIV